MWVCLVGVQGNSLLPKVLQQDFTSEQPQNAECTLKSLHQYLQALWVLPSGLSPVGAGVGVGNFVLPPLLTGLTTIPRRPGKHLQCDRLLAARSHGSIGLFTLGQEEGKAQDPFSAFETHVLTGAASTKP